MPTQQDTPTLPVAVEQHAATVREETQVVQQQVDALTIVTEDDAREATDMVVKLAQTLKVLENQRTFFVQPLNQQVTRINALFKGLKEPIETANQAVRAKLLAYEQEKRRKAEEERKAALERQRKIDEENRKKAEAEAAAKAALEAEAKKGDVFAEAELEAQAEAPPEPVQIIAIPPMVQKGVQGTFGKANTRTDWKYEITDPALVPREYLTPDLPTITQAVRGGAREIPGVRIYQHETLVLR